MKKELHYFVTALLLLIVGSSSLFSQENLQVEFTNLTTVPDFLNICGDEDQEIVTISVDGLAPDDRTAIRATVNLFEGVEFVSFDPANSSAGVTLFSDADPTRPVFTIPDLSPFDVISVEVAFNIRANCAYTDTLTANNAAEVFDTWEFTYNMGGLTNIVEFDDNIEYRDAFAIPSFTLSVNSAVAASRVGDCYTRDIISANTGLGGFVDTIVYTNVQGPGVYVENIVVNGLPINITKTLELNGDTLITAIIDAAYFAANTVGTGGLGDGDAFFDPSEVLTITESICVLDCFENRESNHAVEWGCNGRFCTRTEITDFARIGQGAANPIFQSSGSLPNEYTGYCKTGNSTITFTNDGVEIDAGFATMIDVTAGIGLGNAYLLADNGYQITGVRIAGVDITVPAVSIDLHGNSQFDSALTTDPDGAGGLTDFDGDGYYDDLPLNESIEITVFYEFDCSMAQALGSDETCANNFSTSFSARIDHTNSCQERLVRLESSYFRPANSRSEVENFTTTDAFAETDTFYVTHTETRSVRFFEKSCGSGEQFIVTVVLPTGVSLIPGVTELIRNETTSFPLISNTVSNDTLTLIFDAAITAFINGEYILQMAFEASCSAPLGPTNFPTELGYYCPSCDCRHTWFCGDLQGPQLHSTNPPCPDIACPVGLRTTAFEVNRTTFGYTDETYTVGYDPALANKEVAISCDSVAMSIMNIVGDTDLTDSIGMVITYNNIDESADPIETFLFDYATVRFTNGGNEYFCTVDTSVLSVQHIDSTKILTFDLNECLVNLGITLNAGDTVEFVGNFTVNPEGPYPVQFKKVPNLRGYGYGRVSGVDEACDNFGDIFTIAKNQTVFDFPNSNNFPEGCEETFLQYRLITINNGFNDWFAGEYRQAIGVDSITFVFDTAVLDAYSIFEPQVSIPNHPVHNNDFFPVPSFELYPSGYYVARFDTLTSVPALNNVQSYSFNFRVRVVPNCKSLTASSNGDNRFNFDPKIFFRDRYYATVIGDGSCSQRLVDSVDNDIFYTDPPNFTYSTVSNPNYTLFGDTAVWTVQHCNTSFTAEAGITWIAIEDAFGAIEVVEMTDVSDPANETNLTFSAYGSSGSNYFAFSPGLQKADGSALVSDVCNTIRIKALVNRCGTTNFTSRVGWNCVMYSETNWNPELYPPCTDLQQPLSVTTQDPFLDANIIEQPSSNPEICDTSTIAILVKNTGQGTAFDVTTQFILPFEGVTIVPGSVEFAYPSDAAYMPVPTDPVFAGTNSRGLIYQYDDFSQINTLLDASGLPGYSPTYGEDTTQFVIRYKFVTDCEFRSGSISYYSIQGLKGCGDSTNYETGETLPININGADPGVSKIFDVHFADGTALIPSASTTLEITVENLTTTPTDTTDKILLRLPLDINYQTGSTLVIDPPSWAITEPTIDTIMGYQNLYWCLPAGLLQNDSVTMSLVVNTPNFSCDITSQEVGLFTVLQKQLNCAVSGLDCDVESITSSNNGQLTLLDVNQRILEFDFNSITSACASGGQEQITVDGNIVNLGLDFPNLPFTIRYYHDLDASGDLSTGDPELSNFNESGPILTGDSLPFLHQFLVNPNEVCSILGIIDTTGLDLCGDDMVFLNEPQLLNAGTDEIFCADAPTTIVTTLGDPNCNSLGTYTYNWLALAPADISDLSAANIPNPILIVPHNATVEDTLRYILETTRPGCVNVTRDTVSIVRGLAFDVELGPTIFVMAGGSTTLCPMVSGGTAPFTYSWDTDPTLSDLTIETPTASPVQDSTTYTVTVTSATGCTGVDSVLVIIGSAVTAGVNPSDTTICADATVQLVATGGTDYEWIANGANPASGGLSANNIPNPIFSNGTPNSTYQYEVVVTDVAFPGFSDTADVTINVLTSPTVAITANPGTFICGTETVTLEASGADSYIWENAVTGITLGNNATLIDGPTVTTTYLVTGTDVNGCSSTDQITITVETILLNVVASDNFICPGDTVTLTGGTADELTWFENGTAISTGGTVQVTPILTTTYTLVGENMSGCLDSLQFVVDVLPAPSVVTPVNDFTACGETVFPVSIELDQNIQTYTLGGNGSVANEILSGTTLTFDALYAPDTSNFIITLVGANDGCSITESFRILPCPCAPPEMTSVAVTEATCGNTDGSIVIHLAGDESDYTFEWTPNIGIPNADGNERIGLPFGLYNVLIYDNNFPSCQETLAVLIQNSDGPDATATTTAATCGSSDGTATLEPLTFNYLWEDGNTQAVRTDLASGTYFVTLTDPTNPDCPNAIEVNIDENNPLEANITVNTNPDCGLANGSVTINVNGGVGPYDFSWASGTDTQTGLNAGVYTVTITDPNGGGCSLDFTFALTDNVTQANIGILDTIAVSCVGANDGSIDFLIDYEPGFALPADTIITDGVNTYENGNLPPGDYCLIIQDANDCFAGEACFNIGTPDSLLLWYTLTPACAGGGSIDLTIFGGTGPYTVDWQTIPGSSNPQDLLGLDAGNYPIEVTDANGCTIADFTVIEPCPCTPPTLNSVAIVEATCGNADGTATIQLIEDEGAYTYNWMPNIGTTQGAGNIQTDLPFGGYLVEVTDTLNAACILEVYVLVTNSDGPEAMAATTPATCLAADGTATLTPSNFNYLWSTPPNANFRDDLLAGSYFVTFTDPADPTCPNVLLLEVDAESPLEANLTVTAAPDCGVSNGSVALNVFNGSGDYTYTWADGLSTTDNTRDSLSAGPYFVTITDNGPTGCELVYLFLLADNIATADITLIDTLAVSCAEGADGGIDFTVTYDAAFFGIADTLITDGYYFYENGNLPAGDYCLFINDENDCIAAQACFTVEEPEALDLLFIIEPDCGDDDGNITVRVNGGTAPFTYDWLDLAGTDDPSDRTNVAADTFSLTVTDALGCMITENTVIVPSCIDSCEYFGGLDSLTLRANSCDGMAIYCFDLPLQDVLQYDILDNGLPYGGSIEGCSFDSLIVYAYSELFGQGTLGPYDVNFWEVNGTVFTGEFQDIAALVDSLNVWDPAGNWELAAIGQFITGGNPSSTYSEIIIEALNFGTTSTLGLNFSAVPNGFAIQLDTGYHEIIITNTSINCSDTLRALVLCPDNDNICIGEEVVFCVDPTNVNLTGDLVSMENICPDLADGSVDFVLDEDNFCITYTGTYFGSDTACIQVCDVLGNCDTLEFYVTVDTCYNSNLLVIKDTVYVNQTVIYCPDTTSLPGNIVEFDNYCADLSGEFVDYFLDPYTNCLEYTGVEIGVDSACIVVCDDFGFCDTTLFCVLVEEYLDPPSANMDSTCTAIGTPVVINIMANDTLFGGVDSLYILQDALWGETTLNLDGSVTYNASEEYCERTDSFIYVACTPNGCDTATVFVCLECTDIVIFTAVSANQDGVNDVFFISGIEKYPDSRLRIFNRWGNLIFEKENYRNDWKGTYNGNKDLPDGTYYYMLELNDARERVFTGFLELYR